MYHPRWMDGNIFEAVASKVVCVGRNYAKHAAELGNEVPESPILFIKPETSIQHFGPEISVHRDGLHYEAELALLVGEEIDSATEQPLKNITGVGLALDLTDRELQSALKDKGHPWERAKAFDGAAVMTAFHPIDFLDTAPTVFEFRFDLNGSTVQHGKTGDMIFNISALLTEIAQTFTLRAGDIVLTGTPEGVGQLSQGDRCELSLLWDGQWLDCGSAQVALA